MARLFGHAPAWAEHVPGEVRRAFYTMEELYAPSAVEHAVDQLAVRLTVALQDEDPVLLVLLPRGLVLAGMLMRRLVMPLQQGCVEVSVRADDEPDARPRWEVVGAPPLAGRSVLFLDGIREHGTTLAGLQTSVLEQGASAVSYAVLVERRGAAPDERMQGWAALTCDDETLVGCGLGFGGYGRNLPGLYRLPQDDPHKQKESSDA